MVFNNLPPQIKISVKSANLKFLECGPTCIAEKNCTAKCCDAPTSKTGIRIYVNPSEQEPLKNLGAKFDEKDFILPKPDERVCPFKGPDHLCTLHFTPHKPFGCIASPFALNKNNTLIVRNRYKLLPCYHPDGGEPAYKVFFTSLVHIFGTDVAQTIYDRLDSGNQQNFYVPIGQTEYNLLTSREKSFK